MTKPINPVVLGYLPKPEWQCTVPFFRNVMSFETRYPILWYSADDSWQHVAHTLKAFPDDAAAGAMYPNGKENPWAVNNLVWWTGVGLALSKGYTHAIYLEVDCRVGCDMWDKIMFDEFLAAGEGRVLGGTALCYAPCNKDREFTSAWREWLVRHANHRFPIPAYGSGGCAEKSEQIVMVNGALGVYDLQWLASWAELGNTVDFAKRTTAWDYQIGRALVARHGVGAFNHLVHLDCIYSGYGNIMFSEQERIAMLDQKQVVAAHQIKGSWTKLGDKRPTTVISTEGCQNGIGQAAQTAVRQVPTITPELAGSSPAPSTPLTPSPSAEPEDGNGTAIFIVTRLKDAEWLKHCLFSIYKFASGIRSVTLMTPAAEKDKIMAVIGKTMDAAEIDTYAVPFDEREGKGHLHQQFIKCMADTFVKAAYIMHVDSDCIFTRPFSPSDYIDADGRPVICIEPWAGLEARKDNARNWRKPTAQALGFDPLYETMRRLPLVYHHETYLAFRLWVETVNNMPFEDYVFSRRATWPYGLSEFNAISSYAEAESKDRYTFLDVSLHPYPENPLLQLWSHGGLNKVQDIDNGGVSLKQVVPMNIINQTLYSA